MKIKINKIIFLIFLCSIVMLSVVQVNSIANLGQLHLGFFSGLKKIFFGVETQEDSNENYAGLFKYVFNKSLDEKVDENKAREIFETESVQAFLPRWYSLTLKTKIGFMDGFIKYCEKKFFEVKLEHAEELRKKLFDYGIVFSMATTYRGYLQKPSELPKKAAVFVAGAAAGYVAPSVLDSIPGLSRLKERMKVLAAFKGSVNSILGHLGSFRSSDEGAGGVIYGRVGSEGG